MIRASFLPEKVRFSLPHNIFGNLGVELKNNVKKAWWQKFVMENPYNVGVDCAILMNPQTWVASGHLGGFSDPLMDCKECHERFRADQLIEEYAKENNITLKESIDAWTQQQMKDFVEEHSIPCPTCGKHNFTDIRQFNLMFKTFQGVTEDAKNTVYLRPETAQGIFVNSRSLISSSLIPRESSQSRQKPRQYWNHSRSVPGSQKNSNSICSNSLVRNVKLPGVISLRNDFPICPMPNGIFLREVRCTFLKFTKIPCAVSGRR